MQSVTAKGKSARYAESRIILSLLYFLYFYPSDRRLFRSVGDFQRNFIGS